MILRVGMENNCEGTCAPSCQRWSAWTRWWGPSGEFWSPRMMLRRTAWHERDHTGHIQNVLAAAP